MPAKLSLEDRIERFWSKGKRMGDCLIWQGGLASNGYGKVAWVGRESCYVHRVAWKLTYGSLPVPPLEVLHKCDTKLCMEPDHLYEGTQKQNIKDAIDRGRFHMGTKHSNYNKDLSVDDRIAIKTEYATGNCTQQELATKYGISQYGISYIVRKPIRD